MQGKDIQISAELKAQIDNHNRNWYVEKIISPTVAIAQGRRHERGRGTGYWDQVIVLCGSQRQMQEWRWRHPDNPNQDRYDLAVGGIGDVRVREESGKVIVEVVIQNKEGDRVATYQFNPPDSNTPKSKEFSADQQKDFVERLEQATAHVMMEAMERWQLKHPMQNPDASTSFHVRHVSYRKPAIIQAEIRKEIGAAAFVLEEQIDHRGSDAQFRRQIYIFWDEMRKAVSRFDEHGYQSDGGVTLQIVDLDRKEVRISNKLGDWKFPIN